MSHSAENESLNPTPYLYTLRNPIAYTKTLPITIPYLIRLRNTFGFHQNQKALVNQSESGTTRPKHTLELSAGLEVPSRLSARVGAL